MKDVEAQQEEATTEENKAEETKTYDEETAALVVTDSGELIVNKEQGEGEEN